MNEEEMELRKLEIQAMVHMAESFEKLAHEAGNIATALDGISTSIDTTDFHGR